MGRRRGRIEVEITEGAIRVKYADRVLTIANALPPADFEEEADFYIRLDELEYWDAPHQDELIEVEELQGILEAIEEQVEKHGLIAVFE
jgi:hypothetical protein